MDLPEVFASHGPADAARLITFFGMIPNFEPDEILPKLASLVRLGDGLLFSANLAPGPDYAVDRGVAAGGDGAGSGQRRGRTNVE